jgi:hypothetical protein
MNLLIINSKKLSYLIPFHEMLETNDWSLILSPCSLLPICINFKVKRYYLKLLLIMQCFGTVSYRIFAIANMPSQHCDTAKLNFVAPLSVTWLQSVSGHKQKLNLPIALKLKREQATASLGTDCLMWGFKPHIKKTTCRSRGLLLPEGIGNKKLLPVACSLFPSLMNFWRCPSCDRLLTLYLGCSQMLRARKYVETTTQQPLETIERNAKLQAQSL